MTITGLDPSQTPGRPQGDTEDESGGLPRFTPAERREKRKKKKEAKEEAAKEKPFKVLSLAT